MDGNKNFLKERQVLRTILVNLFNQGPCGTEDIEWYVFGEVIILTKLKGKWLII